MLTVVDPEPNSDGDPGLLVRGMRGMANWIHMLEERRARNPRLNPEYHEPTLQKLKLQEQRTERLTYNLRFTKYGTFTFDFRLPIFLDLPMRTVRREAIECLEESEAERREFRLANPLNDGFLFKPLTFIISSLLVTANALPFIAPNTARIFTPSILRGTSLLVRCIGLAGSITFFAPILAFQLTRKYYSTKLELLFDEIEIDIKEKRLGAASTKLDSIKSSQAFSILLGEFRASNREYNFKYFFLKALINKDRDYFWDAMEFADTPTQKLPICIERINVYENALKESLWEIEHRYNFRYGEHKHLLDEERKRAMRGWARFVGQISPDEPLYLELRAKLNEKLQACLTSLRNQQFAQAKQQFAAIQFDGFSEHAYPDLAIMYYQIKAVAIFLKDENENSVQKPVSTCLCELRRDSEIIKRIIQAYYPERSPELISMIEGYLSTMMAIFRTQEQMTAYEVENLPELYTPAALAARQRNAADRQASSIESEESEEEQPDEYGEYKIWPPRAQGPNIG